MIAEFWARWRDEYLAILHTRQKFNKKTPNIRVGELVLISDDNCPPSQWPLGRISHVYPGKDGLVRAVTVFTQKGPFDRPVVKIRRLPATLELPEEDEDPDS